MSVGIMDADLAAYSLVPFNLEVMKLSAYYKKKGEIVILSPSFTPDKNTNATDVNTNTTNVLSLSGTARCTTIAKNITAKKYGAKNTTKSSTVPLSGKSNIIGT